MRRFVTLVALFLFTLPFGIAINGCGKTATTIFCNGSNSGPVIGQIFAITAQPSLFGISLNTGQISPTAPTATAVDCKGTSVATTAFTWGVRLQDVGLVDVVPSSGRLCGGTWNRNTGGGVPDFTVCMPTNRLGEAMLTASAGGGVSNTIPVFVHPVATSITIGAPTAAGNCANDTSTSCCPFSTTGAPPAEVGFTPNACLSQNVTGQVAARVFATDPTTGASVNITCSRSTDSSGNTVFAPLVGHLTYQPQDASVVTIDDNGIATARNPGTTLIAATISNASSSAGYFSTCPPARIQLSVPNQAGNSSIVVNQNNTQPITAIVTDTNGVTLNGLSLQFLSTTPRTLPSGGAGTVQPVFPGAGSVTAQCLPPTCNGAALNQVGLYGTGTPITSNAISVTTPGTNSSLVYAASTQSQYVTTIDFSTNVVGQPVRLPYVPNSMVLSTDGSTLYMGTTTELMAYNTATATIREDRGVPGTVLAVSPDSGTVVISDPTRQTITLQTSGGIITSVYGGVGTSAQFSPDSGTVYVAAGTQLLVHSNFTGWTGIPNLSARDVAVTVPSVGAFVAGATTTARSYCPLTTLASTNGQTSTTNQYFPDARVTAPAADHIVATNDGRHVLSVTSTATPTLTDLAVNVENGVSGTGNAGVGVACPTNGLTFTANPLLNGAAVPGVAASAVTGIVPSSDSSAVFLTYTGTGGVLPLYTPAATAAGALTSVPLRGSATAPVAGVFSSDNQIFYTGTAGDNLIHLVTRTSNGFSDTITAPVNPGLVDGSGRPVPANLIQQQPRRTT